MTPLVVAYAALLGLAIGSFLNVVVYRVPRGESVVNPPSACPRCGQRIRARHNVPVLGWLVLRGRCADCGEPISVRYPLVEAGTGLAFALTALRFADDLRLLPAYLAFTAVAIALALIDLDVRRLPDVIVLPSYPVIATLLVLDLDGGALLRALLGGMALGGFFLAVWLIVPGGMGFGDVKLSGLLGGITAYLSWGALLTGAFLAFILGALVGVLLLLRGSGRKTAVPFGPFLLLGAYASILGASGLGEAYLSAVGL